MTKLNLAEIISAHYPDALRDGRIVLQDDGEGIYIKHWDKSIPKIKPNSKKVIEKAEKIHQEKEARLARSIEYPALGDQLDAILKQFKALDVEKVPELEAVIADWEAIKSKFPKE